VRDVTAFIWAGNGGHSVDEVVKRREAEAVVLYLRNYIGISVRGGDKFQLDPHLFRFGSTRIPMVDR
jgi:hypothetical protein